MAVMSQLSTILAHNQDGEIRKRAATLLAELIPKMSPNGEAFKLYENSTPPDQNAINAIHAIGTNVLDICYDTKIEEILTIFFFVFQINNAFAQENAFAFASIIGQCYGNFAAVSLHGEENFTPMLHLVDLIDSSETSNEKVVSILEAIREFFVLIYLF